MANLEQVQERTTLFGPGTMPQGPLGDQSLCIPVVQLQLRMNDNNYYMKQIIQGLYIQVYISPCAEAVHFLLGELEVNNSHSSVWRLPLETVITINNNIVW